MTQLKFMFIACMLFSMIGCGGSGAAIIPTDELTPEQIAAVQAEDRAIEDEESQGQMKPQKKKK